MLMLVLVVLMLVLVSRKAEASILELALGERMHLRK